MRTPACCSTYASAAVFADPVRVGELAPAAGGPRPGPDSCEHHPEFATTTELRRLQYAEDDRQGVGKRSRRELAADYTRRYTTEILDRADLTPGACHRSLIAQRLTQQYRVVVEHLNPL